MSEINITAVLPINNPVRGIFSACRIPPRAASLNAQSAVILFIAFIFCLSIFLSLYHIQNSTPNIILIYI